jgi:hypothetical protein
MSMSKPTEPHGWLLYAGLLFAITAWVPDMWHSKTRFVLQYSLDTYDQVTVGKKPHDCDWFKAPLGDKECEYNREIYVQEVRSNGWGGQSISRDGWKTQIDTAMSTTGEHIYSSDKGKTWTPDSSYSGPKKLSVDIYWTKKEED